MFFTVLAVLIFIQCSWNHIMVCAQLQSRLLNNGLNLTLSMDANATRDNLKKMTSNMTSKVIKESNATSKVINESNATSNASSYNSAKINSIYVNFTTMETEAVYFTVGESPTNEHLETIAKTMARTVQSKSKCSCLPGSELNRDLYCVCLPGKSENKKKTKWEDPPENLTLSPLNFTVVRRNTTTLNITSTIHLPKRKGNDTKLDMGTLFVKNSMKKLPFMPGIDASCDFQCDNVARSYFDTCFGLCEARKCKNVRIAAENEIKMFEKANLGADVININLSSDMTRFQYETQHFHKNMRIIKAALKCETYWFKKVNMNIEASNAKNKVAADRTEIESFMQGILKPLQQKYVDDKLAETNFLFLALKERYKMLLAGEIPLPEGEIAAYDIAYAADLQRVHLREELLKLNSETFKIKKGTAEYKKHMSRLRKTKFKLKASSIKQAEESAIRSRIQTINSALDHVHSEKKLLELLPKPSQKHQIEKLKKKELELKMELQVRMGALNVIKVEIGSPCTQHEECGLAQWCEPDKESLEISRWMITDKSESRMTGAVKNRLVLSESIATKGQCQKTQKNMYDSPCKVPDYTSTKECGNEFYCFSKKCRFVPLGIPCSLSSPCGMSQTCVDGYCLRTRGVSLPSDACTTVLDCALDMRCSGGRCLPVSAGTSCITTQNDFDGSSGCGNGQRCQTGALSGTCMYNYNTICNNEDTIDTCGTGKTCISGKCRPAYTRIISRSSTSVIHHCSVDFDCSFGERCYTQHGSSQCVTTYPNSINSMKASQCMKSSDCAIGYKCHKSAHYCTDAMIEKFPKCGPNKECEGYGFLCFLDRCRPIFGRHERSVDETVGLRCKSNIIGHIHKCKDTMECTTQEKCENFECVIKNDLYTCKQKSDCGLSMACKNRVCTYVPHRFRCPGGNKDCGHGQVCVSKYCRDIFHVCGCETFKEGALCNKDLDCGCGQRCIGEACTSNKVRSSCSSRNDCGNGQVCQANQCRQLRDSTACSDSKDCGLSQTCSLQKNCVNNFNIGELCDANKAPIERLKHCLNYVRGSNLYEQLVKKTKNLTDLKSTRNMCLQQSLSRSLPRFKQIQKSSSTKSIEVDGTSNNENSTSIKPPDDIVSDIKIPNSLPGGLIWHVSASKGVHIKHMNGQKSIQAITDLSGNGFNLFPIRGDHSPTIENSIDQNYLLKRSKAREHTLSLKFTGEPDSSLVSHKHFNFTNPTNITFVIAAKLPKHTDGTQCLFSIQNFNAGKENNSTRPFFSFMRSQDGHLEVWQGNRTPRTGMLPENKNKNLSMFDLNNKYKERELLTTNEMEFLTNAENITAAIHEKYLSEDAREEWVVLMISTTIGSTNVIKSDRRFQNITAWGATDKTLWEEAEITMVKDKTLLKPFLHLGITIDMAEKLGPLLLGPRTPAYDTPNTADKTKDFMNMTGRFVVGGGCPFRAHSLSTAGFNGLLHEALIFDHFLDKEERQSMLVYLNEGSVWQANKLNRTINKLQWEIQHVEDLIKKHTTHSYLNKTTHSKGKQNNTLKHKLAVESLQNVRNILNTRLSKLNSTSLDKMRFRETLSTEASISLRMKKEADKIVSESIALPNVDEDRLYQFVLGCMCDSTLQCNDEFDSSGTLWKNVCTSDFNCNSGFVCIKGFCISTRLQERINNTVSVHFPYRLATKINNTIVASSFDDIPMNITKLCNGAILGNGESCLADQSKANTQTCSKADDCSGENVNCMYGKCVERTGDPCGLNEDACASPQICYNGVCGFTTAVLDGEKCKVSIDCGLNQICYKDTCRNLYGHDKLAEETFKIVERQQVYKTGIKAGFAKNILHTRQNITKSLNNTNSISLLMEQALEGIQQKLKNGKNSSMKQKKSIMDNLSKLMHSLTNIPPVSAAPGSRANELQNLKNELNNWLALNHQTKNDTTTSCSSLNECAIFCRSVGRPIEASMDIIPYGCVKSKTKCWWNTNAESNGMLNSGYEHCSSVFGDRNKKFV